MVDQSSDWDIVRATQYGNYKRCEELVKGEGVDVRKPDKDNITVLHWAAINNRLEIARFFITQGAVIDALGGDLVATPLHWAIREGHLQMVVLLMQNGADPGVRDSDGCAAVHVAVSCGYSNIVSYLIAKGTDSNLFDANGKTPLMWSAWRTFGVDPTRSLISLHASVNQKDLQYRNTPLHWACMSQNTNVIGILLRAGADIEATNSAGETALDIANQKGNKWIAGRIIGARREMGLEVRGENKIWRYVKNKKTNKKILMCLPFIAIFFVGYILSSSIQSWMLKIVILILFFVCTRVFYNICTIQNETQSSVPFSISLATKFWTFFTSFYFYLPVTYSLHTQLAYIFVSPCMFYYFYKVVTADPGFICVPDEEKKQTIVHMAETNNFKMENICTTCLIQKPLRSKHCAVCNKCVARYDHYCPWVVNAIGAGNHHYFIYYLGSLLGVLWWHIFAAFNYWSTVSSAPDEVTMVLLRMWHVMSHSPWVTWMFMNSCLHVLWVSALLFSQLYNMVYKGITTNEQINAYRYNHFKNNCQGKSPFDRGIAKNAADLFRLFGRSGHINWKTKMNFPPEFNTPCTPDSGCEKNFY